MTELFHQLGIDSKLLLAQGLNFLILLVILRLVVYKPLIALMKKRRERIEFGLKGAEEAERRLNEIEVTKEEKLREADKMAVAIIGDAEESAKQISKEIVSGGQKKADYFLKEAAAIARQREQQEMEGVVRKANELVRAAIEKTCELDPSAIDDKLIRDAVQLVKQEYI